MTPRGAPAIGLIKARREGAVMYRKKKSTRNHNNIVVMETGPLLYTLVGAIVIVLVIQGMLFATVFWSQVQNTHAHFSSPQRVLDGAILDQDQAAAAVVRSKQQREQPQLLRHQIPLQEKTGEKRKANSGNASAPKQARPLPATTEEQVKFVSVNAHAPQHMSKDQLIQSQLQKHEESLQDYRVTTAIGHQSPDLMSPSVEAAMCSEHEHIPFVIMAFRRVEYLKQMIASLLASDFPHETVPIVISHDGRVPEMMDYVQSLLNDREHNKLNIIQLVHPHSCYEHPHSFPGNDTSLNVGYAGDSFGNPRSAWATCCKHHFTWMMNTIFRDLEALQPYDTFFFLEEDYVVSRTVYSSLCQGTKTIQLKEQMIQNENEIRNQKQSGQRIAEPIGSNHDEPQPQDVYFGVVGVEPTLRKPRMYDHATGRFTWTSRAFRTGPMTFRRKMFDRIHKQLSNEYCTMYDEYNWDWTLYHLMADGLLPSLSLVPFEYQLVKHIGVEGMHASEHLDKKRKQVHDENGLDLFLASHWTPGPQNMQLLKSSIRVKKLPKGYGGWFHPRDMEHCLLLFGHNASQATSLVQMAEQDHAERAEKEKAEKGRAAALKKLGANVLR